MQLGRRFGAQARAAMAAGGHMLGTPEASEAARLVLRGAAAWQENARVRARALERAEETLPFYGPWSGEVGCGSRTLFIRAAHNYAWAARLGWDAQAASRALLEAAIRLPG